MATPIPREIRDEVERMRDALRAAVRRSRLSEPEIEQRAGLGDGELKDLLGRRAELRVAQVFHILYAIEIEPWSFFQELREAEEGQGRHDAA